jgi:hypothetical protein
MNQPCMYMHKYTHMPRTIDHQCIAISPSYRRGHTGLIAASNHSPIFLF